MIRASGGGWIVMCIHKRTDVTNKLGFVFQKDLMPDFGVFGFVNLTHLSNVIIHRKVFNPP